MRFATFNVVVTCQDTLRKPNQNAAVCRAGKRRVVLQDHMHPVTGYWICALPKELSTYN